MFIRAYLKNDESFCDEICKTKLVKIILNRNIIGTLNWKEDIIFLLLYYHVKNVGTHFVTLQSTTRVILYNTECNNVFP